MSVRTGRFLRLALLSIALSAVPLAASQAAVERVVALAPHAVEMLFHLGAGDRIVATVAYADYPDAARTIPRLGDAFGVSLEALLETSPDLVIVWPPALDEARIARIEALVPVLHRSEPESLSDVATELSELSARLGTGAERAVAFAAAVDALPVREADTTVLALVSVDPPLAFTSRSFVADALARCGARTPFELGPGAVTELSREVLLSAPFDHLLVLAPYSDAELERLFERVPSRLRVDPDLLARPGPRLLDGTRSLCAQIEAAR